MKRRCLNPKDKDYKNYGGRGIIVCERWLHSFRNFYEDIGSRPSSEYTIERINNDGSYEPGNCKWATRAEQSMNRRPYSNNISGYRGIDRCFGKYRVRYKKKNYGYFRTLEAAIEARTRVEQEYRLTS